LITDNEKISISNNSQLIKKPPKKPIDEPFTDKFIKKYNKLKLPNGAPFDERLEFDIYKRQTKLDKYNSLIELQRKKLPSNIINETFNHLLKDAERRKDLQNRILDSQKFEDTKEKLITRKLSPLECAKIADKHLNRWKQRNEMVSEKIKQKEFMKELEETSCIKPPQINKGKYHSKQNSIDLVKRMDEDVKNRREKMTALLQEKQDQENEEVFFYYYIVFNSFLKCLFHI